MAKDEAESVAISFRVPAALAKRLDSATSRPLAPSKSQICLEGLRLVLTQLEKEQAKKS